MKKDILDTVSNLEEELYEYKSICDLEMAGMDFLDNLMELQHEFDIRNNEDIAKFYYEAARVLPMMKTIFYKSIKDLEGGNKRLEEQLKEIRNSLRNKREM